MSGDNLRLNDKVAIITGAARYFKAIKVIKLLKMTI